MKLTKREVTLLFLLGTVAILLIGVNYMIMPLYRSNMELKDTLAVLNDQIVTLQVDQQNTGTIDAQIEKEAGKTAELSAPFTQSIRPEQVSYWLNSLLTANNMKLDSIEFTDVVSAAPNYNTDRSLPPEDKLDLPIQTTADILNGEMTAANDSAAATDPVLSEGAETTTDAAVQESTAGLPVSPETYCTQVIVNTTGSYADIKNFMAALYAGGRSLTVDSLNVGDYDLGGKMAVIAIRFYSVPLTEDVQGESYAFPSPAGQGPLMQENIPDKQETTDEETA